MKRLSEDHKEIASGKKKDEEGYMARSEMDSIERSIGNLRKVIKKGDTQLPAWVQSKITKAADYIDTAAEYLQSDEKIKEELSLVEKILQEEGCGCNKTNKAKKCLIHGYKDCPVKEEKDPKGPVQPYKSPEEIAKKHGVSIELIKKQLKMGIKVEGEHTSDKTDARITALQHLDEVPDYYSKLKKIESKKTKSESVEIEDMFGNKFVEFIDLIKPEDIEKKQISESSRIKSQSGNVILTTVSWRGKYFSVKLFFPQLKLPSRKEVNDEMQKIYPGSRVLSFSVSEIEPGKILFQTEEFDEDLDEGLRTALSKAVDKVKGRQQIGTTASGGKIYVSTKRKPSSVKYKSTPKVVTKKTTIKDVNDDPWTKGAISRDDVMRARADMKATREQKEIENPSKDLKNLVKKAVKRIDQDIDGDVDNNDPKVGPYGAFIPTADGKGRLFTKLQKEGAAWTKKSGKDPEGGLNEKGRKSYERENPGSDLKRPQPKGGPRRDSFCARMKGMKKKLTSSKTANDPNSRINKSLRAWNC
jgi:hypothetical protein